MKIVTLMENTTCREDLCCEHGLSLYLESGKYKILFDAGQSCAFAENAEKLGISLDQVDFCVLSHGHYDHSGGLGKFLEINQTAKVYVSQWAFEPHYETDGRYIGVDPVLQKNGIGRGNGSVSFGFGAFGYSGIAGGRKRTADAG